MKYLPYKISLVLLWIFNITDAVITQILVSLKLARETNPFMKFLMENFPKETFLVFKICVMSGVIYFLWDKTYYKGCRIAIYILSAIYTLNFFYQVYLCFKLF